MKGNKDVKIVINVQKKINELKLVIFDMYDKREISEDEFLNLKSYLDGKRCDIPEDLKEAVDKYMTGDIGKEALRIVSPVWKNQMRGGITAEAAG